MPLRDVTIRYLSLDSPADFVAKLSVRAGVAFARVGAPMPELNRFFYAAVGHRWFWIDRLPWTRAQWMAYLEQPGMETWVLSVDGVPAGYAELAPHDDGSVEIQYFGLLDAFIGQGLGAHMLSETVARAWAMGARRVLLNTCDLDHPAALANYEARGFCEYKQDVQRREIPLTPPGVWGEA